MVAGQELGLVDQDAVELALDQFGDDRLEQVGLVAIAVGAGLQSDSRSYRSRAASVVEIGGPQHRFHAALAIVEVGLQQRGRFSRIHRGVVEIELGH